MDQKADYYRWSQILQEVNLSIFNFIRNLVKAHIISCEEVKTGLNRYRREEDDHDHNHDHEEDHDDDHEENKENQTGLACDFHTK